MKTLQENAVYTYKDLEEIVGVSKRTLSGFVESKKLKPIIFGNKYRFLGSEIIRFLREKEEK
jgi:predicted site-specific integrase-resolvase